MINRRTQSGFTLIELMIVMAIIGILITMAIPSFVGAIKHAREAALKEDLQTLRTAMSRDAGVVREAAGLTRLLGLIDSLQVEHGEALPLVAARLVAAPACARHESRGGHFRADYPHTDPVAERTLLTLDALNRRPICIAAE